MTIPIISENQDYYIIDKPAGFLSEDLIDYFKVPQLTHRLDRYTSGVMVAGKNLESIGRLQKLFKARRVKKTYLALVHGSPQQESGLVDDPITRAKGLKRAVRRFDPKAREAVTKWKVKKRFKEYCLLECRPRTGRTHQLRVHLKALGHPIVGDRLYKFKRQVTPPGLERQFLHALELDFGEGVFRAELPKGLQMLLDRLE